MSRAAGPPRRLGLPPTPAAPPPRPARRPTPAQRPPQAPPAHLDQPRHQRLLGANRPSVPLWSVGAARSAQRPQRPRPAASRRQLSNATQLPPSGLDHLLTNAATWSIPLWSASVLRNSSRSPGRSCVGALRDPLPSPPRVCPGPSTAIERTPVWDSSSIAAIDGDRDLCRETASLRARP